MATGLAATAVPLSATTIEYESVDLPDATPGSDLWHYNYYVSGFTFAVDQGFTIIFDRGQSVDLQSPPPVNLDWDVLTLQPDPALPDNGAYDAFALVNGASLADPFSVSFTYIGSGTPGSQPFVVSQFAPNGDLVDVLETGNTIPRVPEPASLLLMAGAAGALLVRKRIGRTGR